MTYRLLLAATVTLVLVAVAACVLLEILAPGETAPAAVARISAIVVPTITVLLARLQSHHEHYDPRRILQSDTDPGSP